VLLKERPFQVAADLRLSPGGPAAKAVEALLGASLPATVGRCVQGGPYQVLALGPDWWLVLGEGAEEKLRAACAGNFASVVDVSAQRTCIEISGPRAVALLQYGWEQDLDPGVFPAGRCSQGLIAKSPVILHHAAPGRYDVHVRASFSRHLWAFLVDAATEELA
jgi:sarcosine oxidase subunit gamma